MIRPKGPAGSAFDYTTPHLPLSPRRVHKHCAVAFHADSPLLISAPDPQLIQHNILAIVTQRCPDFILPVICESWTVCMTSAVPARWFFNCTFFTPFNPVRGWIINIPSWQASTSQTLYGLILSVSGELIFSILIEFTKIPFLILDVNYRFSIFTGTSYPLIQNYHKILP